ncbi:PAS domain S-box protein [Haloarcula amylovorans]|uniref:PAS domain S-box protein n=1 Tax=Haloarcula amylovorans TaxID=2562280 RepID=UPI00107641EE|nr:PAS domain S-box protein [Halomicroarcula amylolytica]
MGTSGPSSEHTLAETLDVFTERDAFDTPLTTNEVADALDCPPRTASSNLESLANQGELQTKAIDGAHRIWWRPTVQSQVSQSTSTSTLKQAQFDELVEAVTDYAIFVLDADGHVQTWNDGARQIKGFTADDIIGEHFSRFYTRKDREAGRPEQNLEQAHENGRVEDEGERVRKDGSRFWANVTITALHDDNGDLQGFLKVTRDMTERHEYEERLHTEKERFETLVREVKDYAIFMLDTDGIVQTWNDGARQLKGYDDEEIIGEHFSRFYTRKDREAGRPERNLEKARENGRIEDEGERVRKDGSRFWANVIITALHDDDGNLRGFAKVTRDMTERHEYEQRLKTQHDELDELNQINAVIRDIDQALVTATSREEIEQAVCDRLAASDTYSAAWIAEYTDDYKIITPRTWANIDEAYLDAIRTADADPTERTERGVGATALKEHTVQPIHQLHRNLSDEPWRDASLAEGYESAITVPLQYNENEYGVLTVYAESESAFDERKIEVLSELGETISHAIAAIKRKEREQTLTALQESTRKLLNTETETEIGDIIVETLTDDAALADAVVYRFDPDANALDPVSTSFESALNTNQLAAITADADSTLWTSFRKGETRFVESVAPEMAAGDRRTMVVPLGQYGVLAVTEAERETFAMDAQDLVHLVAATAEAALKRTERERHLQNQNKRLDNFASMLAHELRNPVNIGQIYSQQLPSETDADAVEYVTEAFDRIDEMIDVMLVLTRGREAVGKQTAVDLADAAREAWTEVDTLDAMLDIETKRRLHTDETYLYHLFRNLFENAVEHGGSNVTVTVGELEDGFYVSDDGIGIPPDKHDAVFEEGYTTAGDRGGTGLGLAFVNELAEVYDWECRVVESEDGGARFEFANLDHDPQ